MTKAVALTLARYFDKFSSALPKSLKLIPGHHLQLNFDSHWFRVHFKQQHDSYESLGQAEQYCLAADDDALYL